MDGVVSPRGPINLPIVIAVVLGLGFGASAYLNFAQYQRTQQEKKLLKGEITDLRYQVQQDKLASNTQSSPTPEPSESPEATPAPTPTPTSQPEVAGASTGPQTAVVKAAANLRSAPSANSTKLISMIPAGTTVTLSGGVQGGYHRVTVNGKTGYILESYIRY